MLTSSISFIKIIAAGTGGTVTNYSNRFSLSGMTGTFPAAVTTGLQGLSGTSGPATENNYNAAAGGNAAGAGGPVAAGATVTYTQQTGPIRYAPMQGKPGTKITAKSASARYPSSSVSIAKTWLPTPEAITTHTVSATYSTSSHANTVSIASIMGPSLSRSPANGYIRLLRLLRRWMICRNTWLVGGIERKGFCFLTALRAAF